LVDDWETIVNEQIKELAAQAETHAAENSGAFRGEIYMRCFTEKFAELVAAAEREACAKVCDLVAREIDDTNGLATYIAKGIRARGEK
jgi:hypothetical protein